MTAAKKSSAKPVAKVKAGTVKTGSASKAVKAVKTADSKKEKVVLAYSGGLDTTVDHSLAEGKRTATMSSPVCINVGQDSELKNLDQRARSLPVLPSCMSSTVIDEFCRRIHRSLHPGTCRL
jgi:PP-loop superfamily ATP-utilizing enzyme